MEPTQQPPKSPKELEPHWHERLLNWSGWEKMAEYRAQFIGAALSLVVIVILIGLWYSRSESSSVANTLRAEAIVHRLRLEEVAPEKSENSTETDLTRLKELSPPRSALFSRFSGVVAEEEVLQHVQPLSKSRFDMASLTLCNASLPLFSSLTTETYLSHEGKGDDALRLLDETIDKTKEQYPIVHMYALLQKAVLLREQQKANASVIDEVLQFAVSHVDANASLDRVFAGKVHEALDLLRSEP